MKFFTASAAFALFAVLAQAAPAPNKVRAASVNVRFEGADPDAFFEQSFPLDGSTVDIGNPLSITWIKGLGGQATCTFNGVDGSVTTVTGPAREPVGPPQTQVSGSCVW